jgi:hypothetical protein
VSIPSSDFKAGKQIEKYMSGYEHMEMTASNFTSSVTSHSISASDLQGSADSKSATVGNHSNGSGDSVHLNAPPPSISASPEGDATMVDMNSMSSSKTAGQYMAEGCPSLQFGSRSAIRSGVGTADPKEICVEKPSGLDNAFEDMDLDEFMSRLMEMSDQIRDEAIPSGGLTTQALCATPERTAKNDRVQVDGNGPSLQALDLNRTEQHPREPTCWPNRHGAPEVAHWNCHLCHTRNNAALCGEQCIPCAHQPCIYCSKMVIRGAARRCPLGQVEYPNKLRKKNEHDKKLRGSDHEQTKPAAWRE